MVPQGDIAYSFRQLSGARRNGRGAETSAEGSIPGSECGEEFVLLPNVVKSVVSMLHPVLQPGPGCFILTRIQTWHRLTRPSGADP